MLSDSIIHYVVNCGVLFWQLWCRLPSYALHTIRYLKALLAIWYRRRSREKLVPAGW